MILLGLLFVLFIFYHGLVQRIEVNRFERNAKLNRLNMIFVNTNKVMLNSRNMPISNFMKGILHKRIEMALKGIVKIDPVYKNAGEKLNELQSKIKFEDGSVRNIEQMEVTVTSASFMLNVVTDLSNVLKKEYSKSLVSVEDYVKENDKLHDIAARINSKNIKLLFESAKISGDAGLLINIVETGLEKINGYKDSYSRDLTLKMTEEIRIAKELIYTTSKNTAEQQVISKKSEMDEIFGKKKVWY